MYFKNESEKNEFEGFQCFKTHIKVMTVFKVTKETGAVLFSDAVDDCTIDTLEIVYSFENTFIMVTEKSRAN